MRYLILLVLLCSGCTQVSVKDCIVADDSVYQVIKIGKFSYLVKDQIGNEHIILMNSEKQLVDCFDWFKNE